MGPENFIKISRSLKRLGAICHGQSSCKHLVHSSNIQFFSSCSYFCFVNTHCKYMIVVRDWRIVEDHHKTRLVTDRYTCLYIIFTFYGFTEVLGLRHRQKNSRFSRLFCYQFWQIKCRQPQILGRIQWCIKKMQV